MKSSEIKNRPTLNSKYYCTPKILLYTFKQYAYYYFFQQLEKFIFP